MTTLRALRDPRRYIGLVNQSDEVMSCAHSPKSSARCRKNLSLGGVQASRSKAFAARSRGVPVCEAGSARKRLLALLNHSARAPWWQGLG